MATKIRVDRFGIALEAALRHHELESALSGLMCGAMERIANGKYGRCVGCSVVIAPERLRALPWVKWCAACQDAADHGNEQDRSSVPGDAPDESDGEPSAISENLSDSSEHPSGYFLDLASVPLDRAIFIDTTDIRPIRKKT